MRSLEITIVLGLLAGCPGSSEAPPAMTEEVPDPAPAAESVDPNLELLEKAAGCPYDRAMGTFKDCPDFDAWKAHAAEPRNQEEMQLFAQSMLSATSHPDPGVRHLAAKALVLGHLPDARGGALRIIEALKVENRRQAALPLARTFRGMNIQRFGIARPFFDMARSTKDPDVLLALLDPIAKSSKDCKPCEEWMLELAAKGENPRVQAATIRAMGDSNISDKACVVLRDVAVGDGRNSAIVGMLAFVKAMGPCKDHVDAVIENLEQRVGAGEAITPRLMGIRGIALHPATTSAQKKRLRSLLRAYRKYAGAAEQDRIKSILRGTK